MLEGEITTAALDRSYLECCLPCQAGLLLTHRVTI